MARCSSFSASQTGTVPFGGGGVARKPNSSCTFTSLDSRHQSLVLRGLESTEKSIDDGAGAHQLHGGGQCCGLRLAFLSVQRTVKVSPLRQDQGACAVGQHENEMQAAVAMCPPQHFERLTLEGVMAAHDGHSLRIAVQVVVGSVSCVPLTI